VLGINDVKLAKKLKLLVFVCQQCKKFSIVHVNYSFEVKAKSMAKVPFVLPAVTIGPQVTTLDLGEAGRRELEARLLLYTKLIPLLNSTEVPSHVSVVLIFLTICPCFGFSRKKSKLRCIFQTFITKIT
jgi:hypothetical protein